MVLLSSDLCNFNENFKEFKLINVDGNFLSDHDVKGEKGTLVMFICNHCPYVKAIIDKLVDTTNQLQKIGVNSVAIMPNDVEKYPEDNFENMKKFSKENKFNFPYLFDENQNISKMFGAVCTPDFFGYNCDNKLQYRGRLAEMKNLKFVNKKNDLMEAMLEISVNKKGPVKQFPSAGCSIKWK